MATRLVVGGRAAGSRCGVFALAIAAVCISACSVYDASLLRGERTGGVNNPGPSDDDDAGASDAAVFQCKGQDGASCVRPHAVARCVDNACVIARCTEGYVDCDGNSANGCEAKLDSSENCGLCKAACRYNHASARCNSGRCELGECEAGYGNCDGDDDNGCETDLNTLSDCGECGKTCTAAANARAGCKNGKCGILSCVGPFGDCDGNTANGCEERLDTPARCGACNGGCNPLNADGMCRGGTCFVTGCDAGHANCNGLASDGCETKTDDVNNCGGCGRTCELAHVERHACARNNNQFRCVIDHGCEGGGPDCQPGGAADGCSKGYADCDGNPANGCETDLSRLTDCGSCKNSCVKPNTTSECREGKCMVTGCAPGSVRCGNDACRSLASDAQNCGACGQACTGERNMCAGGKCTNQICSAGRGDCDGNAANGCEVDLLTVDNCGVCGQRCANPPHASAVCRNNACGIGTCDAGWKDCDGDPVNGCEVDIRTTNDCGECATPCVAPNAETSCAMGRCQISRCSEGRGNCNNNIADGCEADFDLPTTCGGCNNQCATLRDVLSSSCDDGTCNIVCGEGRANCDDSTANGCEADLTNPTTCGRCQNDCTRLQNVVSAVCDAGSCTKLMCRPGFADCNGDPTDGCERSLSSATDCGACNKPCAPAHANGSCTAAGSCELGMCDTGFADCNRNAADGCEASLAAPESCGSCGNVCAAGATCTNGVCGCATDADCAAGLTCCNGTCANTLTRCFVWPCIPTTDAPESQLNCGACGQVCLLWCCDA